MKQQKRIFALGFFDGVHLGHQALLGACVSLAESAGAEAAAITFDRHPRSLFTQTPPPLISTAVSSALACALMASSCRAEGTPPNATSVAFLISIEFLLT